ncbi:MAG: aldo/keto reductase [Deltaproteobacteria bacterium]|nr:aldo/keto reductase [Deltaproteobacteria bacterium]
MKNRDKNMDRRTFLKTTGIVGGASFAVSSGLTSNALASEQAKDTSIKAVPTRIMGKSGIPVSILSFGGLDWSTNQNLLRLGFTMGVTMWDTSDRYQNGKSELGIGEYFGKHPEDRQKVFISTKATEATDPAQITAALDQSLERMKTDYVDLYMLSMMKGVPTGAKELMEKFKKEGKVKLVGFSSHLGNDQVVAQSIAMGWVDVLMITYNYILMQKDQIRKQIDDCAKAGIGLIAIKSQAKTHDAKETPEALAATQYFMEKGCTLEQAKIKAVLSDERIASVCSDITSVTILKDNVAAAIDNLKLSSRDLSVFKTLAEAESRHYCQGCGKCLAAMGNASRIPDVMRYMMYYNSYGDRDRARGLYRELPEDLRKCLASRDYSLAESACPHGLRIGKIMREASTLLA